MATLKCTTSVPSNFLKEQENSSSFASDEIDWSIFASAMQGDSAENPVPPIMKTMVITNTNTHNGNIPFNCFIFYPPVFDLKKRPWKKASFAYAPAVGTDDQLRIIPCGSHCSRKIASSLLVRFGNYDRVGNIHFESRVFLHLVEGDCWKTPL
jgi:hypothetical protein